MEGRMSRAGMYSNRGDEYQVLVAVNLALDMLDGESIQSLECEVLFDAQGREVPVDDIVVHHKNGDAVFCQCKVNSPGYGNWTFSSLREDLLKAWKQFLCASAGQRFVFYSASPFPVLTGIIECARMAENDGEFLSLMSAKAKREYENFRQTVGEQNEERLRRFFLALEFRNISLEQLQKEIPLRLRRQVAGGDTALAAIKEKIRRMAARTDAADAEKRRRIPEKKFHLTRQSLLDTLATAGCRVTPLRSEEELKRYVEKYSLRGTSWPRDIEGRRFFRSETQQLLRLVEEGQNALLTGEAGAGKTCILLDLWDALKERSDLFPVFVQARDLGGEELGNLTETFVDAVARMAERRKVVVVVDSLDVLSMAGEAFFGPVRVVLEQLRPLKDVTVTAACRKFDFDYDPYFDMFRPWKKVEAGPLEVEKDILPWLEGMGVEIARLSEKQKALISLPRMLGMFLFVWRECGGSDAVTAWELAEEYLRQLGRRRTDWPALREQLEDVALRMLEQDRLSMGRDELNLTEEQLRFCESEGVLWEEKIHRYTFIHQTWTDWLAVSHAMRNGKTLLEFITGMSSRPSLRAAVRVFFFALRERDSARFRREVREALRSPEPAFHFKWLLAVSMAEVEPEERDASLLSNNRDEHLFFAFLEAAEPERWFAFLCRHLLPLWKEKRDLRKMVRFCILSGNREGVNLAEIVRLWRYLLDTGREDAVVVGAAVFWLNDVSEWNVPGLRELFERLMDVVGDTPHLMLGRPLSQWVDAVNGNDDLLWRFITRKVKPSRMAGNLRLECGTADFYRRDFLEGRMRDSEVLLDMAIASMEEWSREGGMTLMDGRTRYFFHDCIRKKVPGAEYGFDMLFSAVVRACIHHAEKNSPWWQDHAAKLWASDELGIRYLCLCGLLAQPQNNLSLVQEALSHIGKATPCGVFFEQHLALLLQKAALCLEKDVLDAFQRDLIALGREAPDADRAAWFWKLYLAAVPAPYRLPESVAVLEKLKEPAPAASGDGESMRVGTVVSPCDEDTLLELSDEELLRLLRYYSAPGTGDRLGEYVDGHFMGGPEELAIALSSAARRKPEAFWPRMSTWPEDIAPLFADAVMEGVAQHAWSRFGKLTISGARPVASTPSREWLWDALTAMGALGEKRKVQVFAADAVLHACIYLVSSAKEAESLQHMVAWTDRLSAGQGSDRLEEFENAVRGSWVSAVCTLAVRLREKALSLPPWLNDCLFAFAADSHPGPRSVLLRHLAFMRLPAEEGWTLFDRAVAPGPAEIWDFALDYLYDRMDADYEKVMNHVEAAGTLPLKNSAEELGEILTWAFLLRRMSRQEYLRRLSTLDHAGVWRESLRMLVFNAGDDPLREMCFAGIRDILACRKEDRNIISEGMRLFSRQEQGFIFVPYDIVEAILTAAGNFPDLFTALHGFPEWCRFYARHHCREAFSAMARFWDMPRVYWDRAKGGILCELLKMFFQEAEEAGAEDPMREEVNLLVENILKKEPDAVQTWLEDTVQR